MSNIETTQPLDASTHALLATSQTIRPGAVSHPVLLASSHKPSTEPAPKTAPSASTQTTLQDTASLSATTLSTSTVITPLGSASKYAPLVPISTQIPIQNYAQSHALEDSSQIASLDHVCPLSTALIKRLESPFLEDACKSVL